MAKILGSTTTYHETEHLYLNGYRVRIVAVLENAARPDIGVDGPDYVNSSNEDNLTRAAGVTARRKNSGRSSVMSERSNLPLLLSAGKERAFALDGAPLSDHPAVFARFRVRGEALTKRHDLQATAPPMCPPAETGRPARPPEHLQRMDDKKLERSDPREQASARATTGPRPATPGGVPPATPP
jgi:hypothetical protein